MNKNRKIWKYLKWGLLLVMLVSLLIPSYRYFGSLDWSRKHTARIAALSVLKANHDTGEYRIQAGSYEFLTRVAGLQNDGPAVILLHGFPESSIMWEDLLSRAAEEGYRVIAFDQRGYSPGARPKGKNNYSISDLTKDVLSIADHLRLDSFHLVGHDWGAVIAWNVAIKYPDRLHSLTTLAIPHIGVFFDGVINDPEQKLRSGYFERLQLPVLPEYKFIANDQEFFQQMMGNNPPAYLQEYLALFGEPGAATATLNWYRAMDVDKIVANKTYMKSIQVPTLFMWGTKDGVLSPSIIPNQKEWISAPFREVSLETGHGLIQSEPDTVILEILAHLNLYEAN